MSDVKAKTDSQFTIQKSLTVFLLILFAFVIGLYIYYWHHRLYPPETVVSDTSVQNGSFNLSPSVKIKKREMEYNGKTAVYYEISAAKPEYIVFSRDFAPEIKGFAGSMDMAARLDADGRIKDFRVMKTEDTPEYFEQALAAKERYLEITPAMPEVALPHVTGATFSSAGISKTLQLTARRFLATVQSKSASATSAARIPLTAAGVALALFIIAAHVVRYNPSARRRTLFLAAVVLLFGFILQIQFSSATLAALAFWSLPDAGVNGAFLLVVVLPVGMLFSGNLYCGWLCPFGALQELAGQLNRSSFYYRPPKKFWLPVRRIKYFILAGLLIALLLTLNLNVLNMDVLNHAFSRNPGIIPASMVLLILGISFFTPRFWCRNLCPAGAFLAFFNKVKLIDLVKGKNKKSGLNPVIHPGRCDMGIGRLNETDCLNCDRCRMAGTEKLKERSKAGKAGMIYLSVCILFGAAVLFPGFRAVAASVPCAAADSGRTEKTTVAAATISAANPAEVRYKDGVYTGKAKGYDTSKDIAVQVTVKNGRIINVKVLECFDDSPQSALTDIPSRIVAAQSTEKVDAVTGATFTSKGIMTAVKNALAAAKE